MRQCAAARCSRFKNELRPTVRRAISRRIVGTKTGIAGADYIAKVMPAASVPVSAPGAMARDFNDGSTNVPE